MEPLAARYIDEHISDIHREAAAARLAKAAAGVARRRRRGRAAPRAAVRWVSNGLMFLATRLDPGLRRAS